MKGILYLLGLWLFLSCNRNVDRQSLFQGTYVGSFQRGTGRASQVELTFTGNRFSGKVTRSSGSPVYDAASPVICRGPFVVSQQTINFQDECIYTANFDWTLILSHEWVIVPDDRWLVLVRNQDRYVLTKQ